MSQKSIQTFVNKIIQPVYTDEHSLKFTYGIVPAIYAYYNIPMDQVLQPKYLKNFVEIEFTETPLALIMPTKELVGINSREKCVIRMPEECKDILSEHPSIYSRIIFNRQFATYFHKNRFLFSDPNVQLLLTTDNEFSQNVNYLAQLLTIPVWQLQKAKADENPVTQQLYQYLVERQMKIHHVTKKISQNCYNLFQK